MRKRSVTSRRTAQTTRSVNAKTKAPLMKGLVYERFVDGIDNEGEAVQAQLKTICDAATKLSEIILPDDQFPTWIQSKIAVIAHDMDEVFHWIDAKALTARGTAASTDMQAPSAPPELGDSDILLFDQEKPSAPAEDGEFMSFDDFDGAPEEDEDDEEEVELEETDEDEDEDEDEEEKTKSE